MIRIHCNAKTLQSLAERHLNAVQEYIKLQNTSYQESLYTAVTALTVLPSSQHPNFTEACAADDWSWLEDLILADVSILRKLVAQDKPHLQFKQFADMYSNRFSRTPETYLWIYYRS